MNLSVLKMLLITTISEISTNHWIQGETSFEVNPNFLNLFLDKLQEISRFGFTLEEFENALLLLCFIRFILYSIKYNPFTSFKICSIGLISCFLWNMALNDCIGAYYPFMHMHPLLKNAYEEEMLFREQAWMVAGVRVFYELSETSEKFGWITPIFERLPHSISQITDPIYFFIRQDLFVTIKQFYKLYFRQWVPFIAYIGWVRVGKKYCPYHVRWHFTFITLYNVFIPYIFSSVLRAKDLLYKTLIPQQRFNEAETLELFLGAWVFVHIVFVLIAMLHAIFSQYFYVPFLTQSVELHVGKRPKQSMYSGGYTAWQDGYDFYNIRWRDVYTLWWGILGRGTQNQRKKNKN